LGPDWGPPDLGIHGGKARDMLTVSDCEIWKAIIAGVGIAGQVREPPRGGIRAKLPKSLLALQGCLTDHDQFLLTLRLEPVKQ
jgi:hypothetical protein